MKLFFIVSILLISVMVLHSQEETDSNERLTRFEKRLRRLSRRVTQQAQQIKDEVFTEVKQSFSNEDKVLEENEEMTNLRQDFIILKQAFLQLNTEIRVVKVKLEEAETANELMQQKIETMENRFSNLSESVQDNIQHGISNFTHMYSKLTNMSDYQETFEERLLNISITANLIQTSLLRKMDEDADLDAEALTNISTEMNQKFEDVYLHVDKSILTTVNRLRIEAIKALHEAVSPTVLQSVGTCDGSFSSEGGECSVDRGSVQNRFLVLHTYNETTSSNIFTVVDLINNSRTTMNITYGWTGYKYSSAEHVYDPFSNRLFWAGSVMRLETRRVYKGRREYVRTKVYVKHSSSVYTSKKLNGSIETKKFISVENTVHDLAVDSMKGMLFYIEGNALKYIKTNGQDGRVIIPDIESSYLTIDSFQGFLYFSEKDRILRMGYKEMFKLDKFADQYLEETRIDPDIKIRYERPMLITPVVFSTCVYDSVTDTLYYNQGEKIMSISTSNKTPAFVTIVPYKQWTLVQYFNNKLYVSFRQGNTTRCDVFDVKQSSFMNIM